MDITGAGFSGRKFPNLFSPLKIGDLTLKNRIISAPMTYPILTSDGCLTPEAAAFYELRAKGGAAVVTVSELIVDGRMGKYYPVQVTIDAPNAKDSLASAARAVRRHGAIASMELSHGGMFALTDGPARGPSDVFEDGERKVEMMTKAMIDDTLESYAKAAAMCREAGFEMLLIHAGHGWLLEQFLSPALNKREDGYGGSLGNRARLALEVIDAVRSAVGPGFPLELRISAEEYIDGGYSRDDIIAFAKLAEAKIDLLQVSTGSHKGSFDKTHLSMFAERGANVHYAQEIKKHVDVPVSAIGALNEPQMLEDIIASGSADAVVMARALLADPYLPRKAMEGRDDEIVRCCRCFTCMAERLLTGLRVCALNPVIGSEYELSLMPPPAKRKRVLVAGGGPGGMQCALTAAERGHDVTLCEKSGELGGALRAERGIPFKADLYRFIEVKALQMDRAGVDVRLGTEVTPEFAAELSPDVLVIAVGSSPLVPPIPGIEKAVMADDLRDAPTGHGVSRGGVNGRAGSYASPMDAADAPSRNEASTGSQTHIHRSPLDVADSKKGGSAMKAAIIGGGLVGCETAVFLAQQGLDVTVLEMKGEVCADANPRHRPLLLDELKKSVICMTDTRVVEVTDDGLVCETVAGKMFVPADIVICAAGRVANRAAALALADCAPYVEVIGDCVKPGNVAGATFRGHFAALDI